MLIIPLIVLPLVFGLAIHRLYQIPRLLLTGELRVPGERRPLWLSAGIAAYAALLGYTLFLSMSLARILLLDGDRLSAYFSFAAYVAAYPVVYFVAAWVFYYAFSPTTRVAR